MYEEKGLISTEEFYKLPTNEKSIKSTTPPFCEWLSSTLKSKGEPNKPITYDMLRTQGLSITKSYFYDILSYGKPKNVSRYVVLSICLVLKLDLEETNIALKAAGFSSLCSSGYRDYERPILIAIQEKWTIQKLRDQLYDSGSKLMDELKVVEPDNKWKK